MNKNSVEVAIIGGGAAGIAAARKLATQGIDCLIIEARERLGGRAFTIHHPSGNALDMGCGWLHSADCNPWVAIATAQGRIFDKALPPWERLTMTNIVPAETQRAFRQAMGQLFARVSEAAATGIDCPVSDLLPADGRWNGMLNAVMTYIAGAELGLMSTIDLNRYEDTELNWRLVGGYGAMIAAHGDGLPAALGCEAMRIDHSGKRIVIETSKGNIEADRVIVTLPTSIIGSNEHLFYPTLPAKTQAARGLPLGLDDKLFITLEGAEEFEVESRVFGRTDRAGTGNYHFRPFGRPLIECYLAGQLARDLEAAGEPAFFDFAVSELTALFGANFAKRLKPIALHRWGSDPYARGAYSYAVPGAADQRAVLAAPVNDRLFFAGEACSRHDFSTAHGAFVTGSEAADRILVARRKS
ncbi:MAG TPA: NAD(P)/FAD-dependent oxidoreductase [Pseudolabrys sp.]|nr:NAD(P)/FAD-dependent oxidoreductase [Pseudolabrys sp.]